MGAKISAAGLFDLRFNDQATLKLCTKSHQIPLTVVGGYFKSTLSKVEMFNSTIPAITKGHFYLSMKTGQ
jgi:hypothetical protein